MDSVSENITYSQTFIIEAMFNQMHWDTFICSFVIFLIFLSIDCKLSGRKCSHFRFPVNIPSIISDKTIKIYFCNVYLHALYEGNLP